MMAEFASPEDWGLQAIVRGFTGDYCNSSTAIAADPNSCYGLMDISKDDHDTFFSFPGIFDELQELCKPFYTLSHSSPTQDSSTVGCPITPSNSISVSKESKKEESEEVHHQTHSDQPVTSTAATPCMPKYKRRKNQHKRVVLQVTAEDLSSDKWAWRKYGQKPIKGSPYPRSYYRCSSSKACLARKQVEQSRTDPSIFIITYTAEHNHSQPTRKNALAGTTRHKFSSPKSLTRSSPKAAKKRDSGRCSPSLSAVLSPETPLLAEEDQYAGRIIERINKDENDMQTVNESRNNGIFIPEVMFDDDFFTGLGDWDGFMSGLGDGHFSTEAVSSKYDFCNF